MAALKLFLSSESNNKIMMKIFLCLTIVSIVSSAVQSFDEDKKSDQHFVSTRQFHMQGRYGRSGSNASGGSGVMVVPRTDRFFMGSRYGKRTSEGVSDEDLGDAPKLMKCSYIGVGNFYKCFDRYPESTPQF